jgi:predicted RNase H-like HicB family nuclease
MKYAVVYERGPNNWSAYAPDLPSCVAAGETPEAVRRLMMEAIRFHIDGLLEDGEPVPRPGWWAEEIEIDLPERQGVHPE